jgi:hypothetical protein
LFRDRFSRKRKPVKPEGKVEEQSEKVEEKPVKAEKVEKPVDKVGGFGSGEFDEFGDLDI